MCRVVAKVVVEIFRGRSGDQGTRSISRNSNERQIGAWFAEAAVTRRPPVAWMRPTVAPVDAHFVSRATILSRAPPACTAVQRPPRGHR